MSTGFRAFIGPLTPDMYALMRGQSWHEHPDCPPPEELALLRLDHWDFAGHVRQGRLVVAREVAREVVTAFAAIFEARFPIAQMVPIYVFGGSDDESMAANNTSAFNFRTISGSNTLSHHATGMAIDINPVQNPWVRGDTVLPPEGAAHLDRSRETPGLIARPGPVVAAFDAIGWTWGGDWPDVKDYHHFQKYPHRGTKGRAS